MKDNVLFKTILVVVVGLSGLFLAALHLIIGVGGLMFAFATAMPTGALPDGIRKRIKQWHGTIDEQFDNLNSLVEIITAHQPLWTIATPLLREITDARDQLLATIAKCKSPSGSLEDRMRRDTLLKEAVDMCLKKIKLWAYGLYDDGILTADDVHLLGFLLPFEHGRGHEKTEATNVVALLKALVISSGMVRFTVDQSDDKNAALVSHGKPKGVKFVLLHITSEDGQTVVLHQAFSKLHNDIKMPDDAHGKTFIAKAAFLKHIEDEPRYGKEVFFTMPKNIGDINH
jgi:hypothetical protein